MPNTTNFNWATPADTDLVKDGALAIRTLGSSIDTSLVDLKGGTTGQVLSKASNTDLDYTWVTTDDANAIQNAIVDAKGDLIAASANDTPARLAVGNNGETLVADSAASTGLRYTSGVGLTQPIVNGAFDVWQRGTSGFSAGGNYCADRWIAALNSGTLAVSRSTDVPTSPYFNYSLSLVGTSASNAQIFTRIESANSVLFAGQTVTLSLWAKNSAGTSKLSYVGAYPSATDNFATTVSDVSGDFTATSWSTSWTRYSVTFTVNALATRGYQIFLYRNGTETSTTLMTGVQLDIGNVALPFRRSGGTIQGELAACQRYYLKSYAQATAPGTASNTVGNTGYSAISSTNTHNRWNVRFPVNMRGTPTITLYSTSTGTSAKIFNEQAAADVDGVTQFIGESGFHLYTSSGTPALGNQLLAHYQASAEL